MKIQILSKTFLIGEYAVLEGSKALLVNTKPCFLFSVTPRKQKQTTLWAHPQSPAGKWLKKYPKIQQSYHIKTYDPHKGKGGFGYSTAQFNLVYVLGQVLGLYKTKTEPLSLWKAYRKLHFEDETYEEVNSAKLKGCVPSGADLVSQWVGGVCVFCPKPFQVRSFAWPFSNLDFFLIRTGVSLNTHQHLKNYAKVKKSPCLFPKLTDIVKEALRFVKAKNKQGFISALNRYSLVLEEYKLTHPKVLKLIKQIKLSKEVKTARGCGAMGAEVVAVFFDSHNKQKVKAFLNNKNCPIISSSQDIYPRGGE